MFSVVCVMCIIQIKFDIVSICHSIINIIRLCERSCMILLIWSQLTVFGVGFGLGGAVVGGVVMAVTAVAKVLEADVVVAAPLARFLLNLLLLIRHSALIIHRYCSVLFR